MLPYTKIFQLVLTFKHILTFEFSNQFYNSKILILIVMSLVIQLSLG